MIPELIEAGLAGIETYYPEHSVAQIEAYRQTCRRHGLVATGGSDYHGPHTGRATTVGSPHVPLAVWEALRDKARELGAAP
jgi:predicted metal-dependent phosphoesterase TrpH